MAVIQIPNLPVAINMNGGELVEIVQGGVSRRTSVGAIANLGPAAVNIPANSVTMYQYFLALAVNYDPNLLYQALAPDFSNPATVQFYVSPFVSTTSPIAVLTQTVYPGIDMGVLFNLAAIQPTWG